MTARTIILLRSWSGVTAIIFLILRGHGIRGYVVCGLLNSIVNGVCYIYVSFTALLFRRLRIYPDIDTYREFIMHMIMS